MSVPTRLLGLITVLVLVLGAVVGSVAAGKEEAVNQVRNPFSAAPYNDPSAEVKKLASANPDPELRALEVRTSASPTALWLGDWNRVDEVEATARTYSQAAREAGSTAVLVLYAIPNRDCGLHSSGGLSASEYAEWVRAVARGLEGTHAAVVLEPDALGQEECLSDERLVLLRDAVGALSDAGAGVYLDAGNSGWVRPGVMARRLERAGVERARGFALNVSNYQYTSDERAYGEDLSEHLGGKHFVVDTSRNGNGPGNSWCNPRGRALGETPRVVTDGSHLDALLWIKRPGQSDGTCGGGPSAGAWWPEMAQELARNAQALERRS